jgi:transposase
LKKIAIELGYNDLDSKIGLLALQNILIQHPAFSPIKKLTKLAEKYGVKVIFCPKFHCELNPIEGL